MHTMTLYYKCYVKLSSVSLLERCPSFRVSLIERFHCILCSQLMWLTHTKVSVMMYVCILHSAYSFILFLYQY